MTTLTTLFLIGPVGLTELLLILVIVVVIFGAKKLPQLGKGFGEGIRNFKTGLKSDDAKQALDNASEADEKAP